MENEKLYPEYTCADCGKPVIVQETAITRPCGHENAPILASLAATCYGEMEFEG